VKRIVITAVALLAAAAIAVPVAGAKPVKPGPATTAAPSATSDPWEGIAVAAGLGAIVLTGGVAFVLHRTRTSPRHRPGVVAARLAR
jgi:hypothetical protein